MTESASSPAAGVDAAAPRTSAGALLRAARVAGGLSIDTVAQQLRLAPRQVTALEEDDYTQLPGRTFVRGFVRNYARFVHLDPDKVLDALPGSQAAPALAAPTLHQTAPTMGELPIADHGRPGFARWAIPLTLAAIVAAAALYEWLRPPGEGRSAPAKTSTPASGEHPTASSPAMAPNPPTDAREAPTPAPQTAPSGGTPLPNPLVTPPAATPQPAPSTSSSTSPSGQANAESNGDLAATTAAGDVSAAGGVQLVLAFRDFSWTEVKDRDGRVLASKMNPGGTTQALSGTPPLVLVIGNAADVSVTYQGKPVDLAPHTRQNVARLTLP